MADAEAFFHTYYAPNNIVAALVGNFEIDEAKALAERYFGRLERRRESIPDVVTLEVPQLAEKRMNAECDCQPQVTVQFHSVPFRHKDDYVLNVIEGLLNGQTGRLNKSLVLGSRIASSAGAGQQGLKYAGSFSLSAESRGDATTADLEAALVAELDRLKEEPVPEEELQKVKNQVVAGSYRNLQSPFFLLLQLLFYEGWGDWSYLNQWSEPTLAVTAEDVQRVAKRYFTRENRTVATYERKAGTASEPLPPELEGLPPEAQRGIVAQLRQLRAADSAEDLAQFLASLEAQRGGVPPQFAPALDLLERTARERLAELDGREAGEESR